MISTQGKPWVLSLWRASLGKNITHVATFFVCSSLLGGREHKEVWVWMPRALPVSFPWWPSCASSRCCCNKSELWVQMCRVPWVLVNLQPWGRSWGFWHNWLSHSALISIHLFCRQIFTELLRIPGTVLSAWVMLVKEKKIPILEELTF